MWTKSLQMMMWMLVARDDKYNLPPTNFTGLQPGPVNIPDYINEHSTPLDFLHLFIGEDVYALLCLLTNCHANRFFEKNPYAKVFNDNPVDIDQMRDTKI